MRTTTIKINSSANINLVLPKSANETLTVINDGNNKIKIMPPKNEFEPLYINPGRKVTVHIRDKRYDFSKVTEA